MPSENAAYRTKYEADLITAAEYKSELLNSISTSIVAHSSFAYNAGLLARTPKESNIIGLGFGKKVASGKIANEENVLRVYVSAKKPNNEIPAKYRIPVNLNGIQTDIIEIDKIEAHYRPAKRGHPVAHCLASPGTIGCIVKIKSIEKSNLYILSNNHVLANCNDANFNDEIFCPGFPEPKRQADLIAYLSEFEELNFDPTEKVNVIDAAIASVININDIDESLLIHNWDIASLDDPEIDQVVYKTGVATGTTQGKIVGISEDIFVDYIGGRKTAPFKDQLAIQHVNNVNQFSIPGDSGSLVCTGNGLPIGLLFAGDQRKKISFANPIKLVVDRFNLIIL